MKIQIVEAPISSINPANYNPRNISESAIAGLMQSIKTFGVVDPLIVNRRNNTLVGGHQRLRAAQELGHETVPVVYLDLDDTQERALNVTLNNPRISGFFTDDLQAMLDELKIDIGDDLFTDLKLDELIIPDNWNADLDKIDGIDENLDGITAIIKVSCPQTLKSELTDFIKKHIEEVGFEGVDVT